MGSSTGAGGLSSIMAPIQKYVIPGLETVGGGVSEFFAPGNPIGIGLMGSGIGQLAGGAAGGSQGQSLGGLLGGLGGGLAGGGGGGLGSLFGGSASGLGDDDITGILDSVNPFGGSTAGLTDATSGAGAGSTPSLLSSLGGLQGITQLLGGGASILGSNRATTSGASPQQLPKLNITSGPTPPIVPSQSVVPRMLQSKAGGKQTSAQQLMALLQLLQQ